MGKAESKLEQARRSGFAAGVKAAAAVADGYNSQSALAFKLGDLVLCKLNQTRRKVPRRNGRALREVSTDLGRQIVRQLAVTDADASRLARFMEPAAWVEYDLGECSNAAYWKCADSLKLARKLLAAGYRSCAPQGVVPGAYEQVLAMQPEGAGEQAYVASLIHCTEAKRRKERAAKRAKTARVKRA